MPEALFFEKGPRLSDCHPPESVMTVNDGTGQHNNLHATARADWKGNAIQGGVGIRPCDSPRKE